MRFSLVINLERISPKEDMQAAVRHITEMAQLAEEGGFETLWAAEHHALEMTVAPAPFQLLAHLAAHTSTLRLGTACVVAPYWHPIRLAGEAALFDLLSGGRLEFGIGKGAYQREFDRMAGGMDPGTGVPMMLEMIPALKALWAGDYEHNGTYWSFPTATSCPKPLQKPHPPIWVAARDPGTFAAAVREGHNIMTWPLTRPFCEFETYLQRFEDALAQNPGAPRPRFMAMRHTGVWTDPADQSVHLDSIRRQGRQFENMRLNLAPVIDGFPEDVDLSKMEFAGEYSTEQLMENLVLGKPEQVIEKLRKYDARGLDQFCYNAAYGLPLEYQRRSLELFVKEVMPAFKSPR